MLKKTLFRLVVVCLLALALIAPVAKAQRKKQIAVLDFDFATRDLGIASHTYGGQQNLGRQISDKLMTGLFGLGSCHVIERSQLERVLREQNLGVAGRIDESTAAKVGRILGVDGLVIGNVSVLELLNGPKNNRDTYWNPKNLKARIGINVRLVNTTTARVEFINEFIGISAPPKQQKSGKSDVAGSLITGILGGNKSNQTVQVKDEQIRDVVYLAVDDAVTKITADLDKYFSGPRPESEAAPTTANLINGKVISVTGPSVVIAGVNKAAAHIGDRLYVRRGRVIRDPETRKEHRFTEKVGEVEVVEIQDEVIIGSFSGSAPAQVGDIVTNSPTGAGITTSIRETQPASTPSSELTRDAGGIRQERIFTLPANSGWYNTNLEVAPGTNFEIIVEGVIKIDRVKSVTGAGAADRARSPRLPLPGAPIGALLAKFRSTSGKDSALTLIGTQRNVRIDLNEPGCLWLGINDDILADNTGAFKVTVRW